MGSPARSSRRSVVVRRHNSQDFLKQRLIAGGIDGGPAHRSATGIGARALESIRLARKSLNLTERCWCTSSMYQYMEQQAAAGGRNQPQSAAPSLQLGRPHVDRGPGICLHRTRDCLGRKFRNRALHGRLCHTMASNCSCRTPSPRTVLPSHREV